MLAEDLEEVVLDGQETAVRVVDMLEFLLEELHY
jgi:hypothetical protein